MTWTWALPIRGGWYWWRFGRENHTAQIRYVYLAYQSGQLEVDGRPLATLSVIGEWSDQPISLPYESSPQE